MAKRVVTCQDCGGLDGLMATCERCHGAGAFVVDDDLGEDPNRYGPGGEVGPRAPAPGLWASATASAAQPQQPQGVPIVAATKDGAEAIQPTTAREANME